MTRDLLIRITQRSTSRLGPLLASHILLNIGALFHIVSIYSKRTFDCLNAAPTITTFLSGSTSALIIAYRESMKDLPKPRLAMSIGNLLFHISHRNNACEGKMLILNMCLHRKEKYSGLVISQSILYCTSSSLNLTRSNGFIRSDSLTPSKFNHASSIFFRFIILSC